MTISLTQLTGCARMEARVTIHAFSARGTTYAPGSPPLHITRFDKLDDMGVEYGIGLMT
jgi:hypothetical protein